MTAENKVSGKRELGLVLSGGGARAFAHLGLLKALDEWKIRPDYFSAASGGAAIAVLYASGMSPEEICKFLKKINPTPILDLRFRGKGVLSMRSNETKLRSQLGRLQFSDLKIPVVVAATDLYSGKAVYISEGDLVKALMASAAIPGVFEPVVVGDQLLVDGSCLACLPSEPLLQRSCKLIGMYVNPVLPVSAVKGIGNIVDRAFHISLYPGIELQKQHFDIYLEPAGLGKFGIFEFDKGKELMEIGYACAMESKERILSFTFR